MTRHILFLIVCGLMVLGTGCTQGPARTIVCIGDSLTACGGEGGRYTDWLARRLPNDTVVNKGIGGDTLASGRRRFQRDVLALRPDVVVIELGANDFWSRSRPIEALRDDLEDMVRRARAADAQVVIASCFGGRRYEKEATTEFDRTRFDYAQAIAGMEADIVRRYGCFYVPNMQVDIKPNGRPPYWDDHNHPNKVGNERVARRILGPLKKALGRTRQIQSTGVRGITEGSNAQQR